MPNLVGYIRLPKVHLRKNPGFSIVEILIFLMLVLAMVTMLLSASGTLAKTFSVNLQSIAVKIATQDIETLHKTVFSSISSGAISNPDLSKLPSSSATRTVTDYGSPPDPNIKKINITVSWTENGAQTSISLDTLIAQNGF